MDVAAHERKAGPRRGAGSSAWEAFVLGKTPFDHLAWKGQEIGKSPILGSVLYSTLFWL